MARNLFPFPTDREIIEHFLSGRATASNEDAELVVDGNSLRFSVLGEGGASFAFYDTGGALQGILPDDRAVWPAARALNAILEMLGDPRRIEGEQHAPVSQARFFLEGVEVRIGTPFVLAGPMSVQAFRAKENV